MAPEIAIVVSNYKCRSCLQACFDALFAQDYPRFTVYLMDNASDDGSVEFTSQSFPSVKIIAHTANYGFAKGYNLAISGIDAEYIAIVNSDTKAAPDWLSRLYDGMIAENAVMAGSKICFMENPGKINSAGNKLTYSGIGADIGYGMNDCQQFNVRQETVALCGAAMLVKREVFLELGGFDEDFFILCEDTDLCWRAWLSGYKVIYEPSSLILHQFGKAIGKRQTPLRVFYSQRNALLIVLKDFGTLRLLISLFVIADYTMFKLAVSLFTLRLRNFTALLTGTFSALTLLPRTLVKRREVQASRKVTDRELDRRGFIAPLLESVREYVRVSRIEVI
jgi:GT2 family glycosyltransferase